MPGLKPQKHQLYHLGPAFGYKQSDGMDFGEDPLKEWKDPLKEWKDEGSPAIC